MIIIKSVIAMIMTKSLFLSGNLFGAFSALLYEESGSTNPVKDLFSVLCSSIFLRRNMTWSKDSLDRLDPLQSNVFDPMVSGLADLRVWLQRGWLQWGIKALVVSCAYSALYLRLNMHTAHWVVHTAYDLSYYQGPKTTNPYPR